MSSSDIWFTSDTHFFHKNIIGYQRPQYKDVEDMNETLIANWNKVVAHSDTIFHLGDFAFGGISKLRMVLSQLNGIIHLVPGNHDEIKHWIQLHDERLIQLHKPIKNIKVQRTVGHQGIVLCHYPIESWANAQHNVWHLHGHSHGSCPVMGKRMDVGIDTNEHHRPYHIDEIAGILNSKQYVARDYHRENDDHSRTST